MDKHPESPADEPPEVYAEPKAEPKPVRPLRPTVGELKAARRKMRHDGRRASVPHRRGAR